ncbi:MAG: Gfo/Idh/MocA family oxidoreductase [Nitrospira sp.]|nr:Gfo/Idh/MocA family oxidoreductase [Nitrospira sp.]
MKKLLGIGLIGVGRHGMRYARHLLDDVPAAVLKAVCRRRPEEGFDLPGAGSIAVYGEARALINDPSVEAVIAVTPPVFSRDICQLAVRARKPILIEKPLAASAGDARAMIAAAREAGTPIMTAQTLRFDATIQELYKRRHLIGRSERLFLTSHIETRHTAPGHADGYGHRGALIEIGIHMLDAVRFLIGEEVRDVRCTMNQSPPAAPETVVTAHLVTQGGTVCMLDIARRPGERVGLADWIGSQGRLEANWPRRRLRLTGGTGDIREEMDCPPSQAVLATLTAFLQAIEDGTSMPITGEDGCRAVEIAEACYQSAGAGGELVVLP